MKRRVEIINTKLGKYKRSLVDNRIVCFIHWTTGIVNKMKVNAVIHLSANCPNS